MRAPFPFFVGRGRSGTTLLRAMFDSHPQMAIPGESHFIARMALQRDRYEGPAGFDPEAFLTDLLAHPRFRLWGLPDEEVRAAIDGSAADLAEALRRAFSLYARGRGKHRYGDKTPIYVIHMRAIAQLFPEARFVHVIRDGRDVALSFREVEFGSGSLTESAVYWKRWVRQGRETGRALGPARYREVRYEDLLNDPAGVLGVLCGFLELDYHPSMLSYPDRANEVARGSAFPDAHGRLALPPTKGLRDWRRQMSREDVALFEAVAGDLLEELGYERGIERPTLEVRLTAARQRLGLEARRVAHGAGKTARRMIGAR